MPLSYGTSEKTHKKNVSEMMHSSTFGEGKPPGTRRKMAFAAAYRKARESGARTKGGKTILKTAAGIRARRRAHGMARARKKG